MPDFRFGYSQGHLKTQQDCLALGQQTEALLRSIFAENPPTLQEKVRMVWGDARDGYFADLDYIYRVPKTSESVLTLAFSHLYNNCDFDNPSLPLYQVDQLSAVLKAWPDYGAIERLYELLQAKLEAHGFHSFTWRLHSEAVLAELARYSPQFYLKLQADYRQHLEAEVGHYKVTGFNLRQAWFLDLEALLSQAAYPNQIYSLDLSHCRLERLPDALFRFKQLQVLSLQGSEALAQDPRLADLPRLKQVNT